MLLTQKPQPINFARHHHRRHPASLSNITVVPHPTSTPGLLALSKPPIRQPSRPHQRPQSPRFPPRSRLHHRPTTSVADFPSATTETLDPARGRSQLHNKIQTEHPRSNSPVRPPDTHVATAQDSATLAFPQAHEAHPSSEPTTLVAQPTGRLARSRRSRHRSTPAAAAKANSPSPERSKAPRAPSPTKRPQPSAPIAVPERRRAPSPSHKISQSDPLSKLTIHTNLAIPLKSVRKDKRRRNKVKQTTEGGLLPLAEWDFPAPGSSDDDGEGEDDEPITPTAQTGTNDKTWYNVLRDGPKTAPLQPSVTQGQFPFFTFPIRASPNRTGTPAPAPRTPSRQARPEHRRAPSQPASLSRATATEGIFNWSEDEAETLPAGVDVHKKMALLFGSSNGPGSGSPLFPSTGTPSPSPRKPRMSRERESVDGMARQLFASSSFQIAPEPVELPQPSFLLGVKA